MSYTVASGAREPRNRRTAVSESDQHENPMSSLKTILSVEDSEDDALLIKPFTGASLLFALRAVLDAVPGTKIGNADSLWRGVSAIPWGTGAEATR
jgi:hypothetical protein